MMGKTPLNHLRRCPPAPSNGAAHDGVTLSFGGLRALDDWSMHAEEGELYGIIGPNGAGKTSLLNCINGFYRPRLGGSSSGA